MPAKPRPIPLRDRFPVACRGAAFFILCLFLQRELVAAPPDAAPDYETLTTGMGIGILYEPVLGAGPKTLISDRYLVSYGDEIEKRGFRTVRLRIAMEQFSANTTGTYPHLQLNSAFFNDLRFIVDDLLRRHNGTMYVLISPNGLESGSADDETQMADYWGQIANHFKDYTHRLIFNLMNEPYYRLGEWTSLAQITSMYQALTDAVRPTNPTRYLVYLQMQDVLVRTDGTKYRQTPFSNAGPGETDFNHMVIPANAGSNIIIDFHVLGTEDAAGTDKRFALMRQASEFRAATGLPVWSGAWNWGAWNTALDNSETTKIADEMQRLGLPGTYLMFNSSNTSVFDGASVDKDGDGNFNEWTRPEVADLAATRNPIFWQKRATHAVTAYHPSADAYVKLNLPDDNTTGEVFELQVRSPNRRSFLRFNVNRLPAGTVTSAKLRLRTTPQCALNAPVSVFTAANTAWTERDLSWNTAPSLGATALDTRTVTATEAWIELDVTSALTGNGTYTFALATDRLDLLRFYSRDCDSDPTWLSAPDLVVTVAPSAPANRAPTFSSGNLVKTTAYTGVPYSATLASDATDADGDALRFAQSPGPVWLTTQQSGALIGTPAIADIGTASFKASVSDGRGGVATAQVQIAVMPSTAPGFSAPPVDQTVFAGDSVSFVVVSTGGPAPTLRWQVSTDNGSTWATLSDDATYSGTATATLTVAHTPLGLSGSRYRALASNALQSDVASAAATLIVNPAPTSFAGWRAGFFSSTELATPAVSGFSADPDSDGLSNLAEYALGTDPRSATHAALPALTADATDWIFTYTRPADRPDLSYVPEFSTDLTAWSAAVASHQRTVTGVTETWVARAPRSAGGSLFFRLRSALTVP